MRAGEWQGRCSGKLGRREFSGVAPWGAIEEGEARAARARKAGVGDVVKQRTGCADDGFGRAR